MTTEQKKNYKKSETQDKHCKNEETIGKEPGQPGFLVYKSIPKKEKTLIELSLKIYLGQQFLQPSHGTYIKLNNGSKRDLREAERESRPEKGTYSRRRVQVQ